MCLRVCLHICLHTTCMAGACKGQNKATDTLKLELWMAVRAKPRSSARTGALNCPREAFL